MGKQKKRSTGRLTDKKLQKMLPKKARRKKIIPNKNKKKLA